MSDNASRPSTVKDVTLDLLRGFGIDTVFGNPGSTELPFLDAWPDDIRYVLGLQESSVVAMADGYAQATGNAAFVNLHSAAGLGHALGNISTAFRNQTPMVITAGQQVRELLPMHPYLFAEQATEFPKALRQVELRAGARRGRPAAIARAYYTAMQKPCGPTFVSIPIDDWNVAAQMPRVRTVARYVAPDPALLKSLAEALDSSERPALVVGAQIDQENVWDATVRARGSDERRRLGRAVLQPRQLSRAPSSLPGLFAGGSPRRRKSSRGLRYGRRAGSARLLRSTWPDSAICLSAMCRFFS